MVYIPLLACELQAVILEYRVRLSEVLNSYEIMATQRREGNNMAGPTSKNSSDLGLDQILSIRPVVAAEPPQWSPDGARVLYVSSQGDTTELWSVSDQRRTPNPTDSWGRGRRGRASHSTLVA